MSAPTFKQCPPAETQRPVTVAQTANKTVSGKLTMNKDDAQNFLRMLKLGIVPGSTPAKTIFHGGCHGCLTQDAAGIEYCRHCKFFEADWELPSLRTETKGDIASVTRTIIRLRYDDKVSVRQLLKAVIFYFWMRHAKRRSDWTWDKFIE